MMANSDAQPKAMVDFPSAVRGASLGFSVLVIGIMLSAVIATQAPRAGVSASLFVHVIAFTLASRRLGHTRNPALHGAAAASAAYALTLPLILRDPAGRNLTQISLTIALAITVGALTGWLASRVHR